MKLTELFTAGIFYTAVLAFLLTGFNALLSAKITPINDQVKELKTEQKEINKSIKALNAKLDQLLSKKRRPASSN